MKPAPASPSPLDNDALVPPRTGNVYDANCTARHALELISGKWAMLILPALADGPVRNGELLRRIGGISQKMLTQTLKELERNGLVIRCDLQIMPLHVEYELSPLGASLSDALVVLDRWAERHGDELDAARERFDAGPNPG
ncbi:helix-turn-helix transcriptional regulator [Starkeya sp. ORNL1]|uniref:winged helix-turn-helix transcriptional regulator n=1 Tax=Starkeya sp. ORNL1 TaxID=2709380 RepID=UPI0014643B16|nr:helix-turn-helix domain-containing protein [Starkeya sp. ORNL1]QJP15483.1 helix-turn-helix transcriptional regulator [Starkeya sp. ORNL1]